MSDVESAAALLESLRYKRGYRRGQVTKAKTKAQRMQDLPPDDMDILDVDDQLLDLQSQMATHDAIQAQIEEVYAAHPSLVVDEEDERERISDAHRAVKNLLLALQKALPLWGDSTVLLRQVEQKLDSPRTDSPMFRSLVESFHSRFTTLSVSSQRYYRSLPALKDRCELLESKLNALVHLVEDDYRDAPATPPVALTSPTPVSDPVHSSSALHLELPHFDGDPFKWANFATMFKATIKARAKGHSNLEIRGHLVKAVKHPAGQKILHNLPREDMDLDAMLKLLEDKFGSPDVLGPLIIQKISSVSKFRLNALDIDAVYDNVILPFQRFTALVGDSLGSFLAMTLVGYMDPDCKKEWLRHKSPDSPPDMDTILKFVRYWQREFQADDVSAPAPLHSSCAPTSTYPSSARPSSPTHGKPRHQHSTQQGPRRSQRSCPVCGESHILAKCTTFIGYDVDKKNKVVREKRLCLNCFGESHGCRTCPSKYSCRSCGGRHNTYLHRERDASVATPQAPPTPAPVLVAAPSSVNRDVRFLYSAIVVLTNGDRTMQARALLDGGAAIPLISEHMASQLDLKRVHDPIPVNGIAGTTQCKYVVTSSVSSFDCRFQTTPLTFTVIPKLEPLRTPHNRADILKRADLSHFRLADPELGGRIDLVLGIEQTSDLTTGKPFQLGKLRALPTRLGLCLSGPLGEEDHPTVMTVAPPTDLQDDLSKLWQLDQVPETSSLSSDEQAAVSHYLSTHTRVGGRYAVSLPRVQDPPTLGDTRRQAVSRLFSNERSLANKDKLNAFSGVLQEYLDLGHAETVPPQEIKTKDCYYLPVHAVLKESSSTTKVRAVFDASARSTTGFSLNDQLLAGPNLYPSLSDVLTRFRCHAIGMCADISKMFREILLHSGERDWHRFLMRTQNGSITDCRMLRLTFGVKSSPFLATQVLRSLASDYQTTHPLAAEVINRDFYVDDVLTGAPTVEDADTLRKELFNLLAEAGMKLRKWRTNSPELKNRIPQDLLEAEETVCAINPGPAAQKALGVHWDTQADNLQIAIPDISPSDTSVTKRKIASGTAGVFDVLGLFAPVVICARILFQDTWRLGLSWDEDVPPNLHTRWTQWITDLPIIHQHPVPRKLLPDLNSDVTLSLHGFCDASSVAYGAVVYARMEAPDGTCTTSLVMAKARVLPTKPLTIPKAELSGALLLSKLIIHVANLLSVPTTLIHAWTDSEIVLHWLPKAPSQLNRFVANRISAIQQVLPAEQWRHVPSAQNPADLASRGIRASDLINSSLWWAGPGWLRLLPEHWPPPFTSKPSVPIYSVSLKPCLTLPASRLSFLHSLWSLSSNFFTLARIVCYILRFCHNCKLSSDERTTGPPTYDEVVRAKHKLYRLSQEETLPELFLVTRSKSNLPRHHPLNKFKLCISEHGHVQALSRVRDPDSPTTPLLLTVLSTKSLLTRLLVTSLHKVYGHAGVAAMLSLLANSFWIPGLRNLLKHVSKRCSICQRAYARPICYSMGLLPLSRSTPAPPFDRTGVDFAGPFMIRKGYTRRPVLVKTYAAVFVCLTTKSIHLDLCSSLSTEDFLAVLQRFVARRGCPSLIMSDNGTNFSGAREEIRDLQRLHGSQNFQTAITNFSTSHGIQWTHIPPRAPHFGGLWESAVRCMKTALRKTTAPHPMTWEETYTLLVEAEGILNSRPLIPISANDADENSYLTAGHFLIGRPLLAMPSRLPPSGKISLLRRWNLVSRLRADLWRYWLSTYLASCAQRTKWTRPGYQLKTGDIVFIRDESFKSRDWPIAKVVQLHPGDDGVSRAATLRCKGKLYKRPVNKLILAVTEEDGNLPQVPATSSRPGNVSGTLSEIPDNEL